MNLDRDFVANTEDQVEELFQFALEFIEEKFRDETTDIKLMEFEHCFTMVKERGKPGKVFQDKVIYAIKSLKIKFHIFSEYWKFTFGGIGSNLRI